jgi:hypothetical protein
MPDGQTPGFEVVAGEGRKGSGLFARRRFERGDPLYEFDYWSRRLMPIHSTNHSCDPNAGFDPEGMLRALRTIAEGEEITYDYLLYPIAASPWNFECECGSSDCKGWIDARRDLEDIGSIKEDAEQTHAAEDLNSKSAFRRSC